jgi:hypothetical protein
VVLAGSYIARHRNLDRYLHVYEKQWNRIVQHAHKQERSRYGSVNATFEASVNILENENSETSQDALQLLQTLSTLAASNVPLSLFEEAWSGISSVPEIDKMDDLYGVSHWHVSRLPEFLDSAASEWDSYRLIEACNTLETLAIITSSGSGDSGKLSMHPLIATKRGSSMVPIIALVLGHTSLTGKSTSCLLRQSCQSCQSYR